MNKIGFIGIGKMGGPMVLNLLNKGYSITIYDIRQEAMRELIQKGAEPASTPREVAQSCQIVCSSLPTPEAVETVYLGDEGVLAGAKSGSVAIDFSTISPFSILKVSEKAKKKKMDILEAPVSGGVDGARAGSLTIMVGGERSVLEKVRPILEVIGKTIHYVGKIGTASTIKVINQLLVGVNALAAVEAITLGVKAGVNPQLLYKIIKQSAGSSYVWEKKLPKFVLPRAFDSGFSMKLMYKDLRLAADLAERTGSFNLLSGIAEKIYRAGINMGLGEKDYSSIITLVEKMCAIQAK